MCQSFHRLPLLGLALLTACVHDPVYQWRDSQPPGGGATVVTMSGALAHLDRARSGYRAAIREQAGAERGVGRTLIIGSGALLTAAGLKAPADVLLTGGALIGTAYALGSVELPRARINAYVAGIEALNCAELSVAAIRLTDTARLRSLNGTLANDADELERTMAVFRVIIDKTKGIASSGTEILGTAGTTLGAARSVVQSTGRFVDSIDVAANELFGQVEKIDVSVTEAVVAGTPDISQVKTVAGGLGANVGGIVTQAVSDANASRMASGGEKLIPHAGGGTLTEFEIARNDVIVASEKVRQSMAKVKALLPADLAAVNTDALKLCGLPAPPTAFMVNPDSAQFSSSQTDVKLIKLSGGVKEYVLDLEASNVPSGITVVAPGKLGEIIQLRLDGKANTPAGSYKLFVHDQSPAAPREIKIYVSQAQGSASSVQMKEKQTGKKGAKVAPAVATPGTTATPPPVASAEAKAILALGRVTAGGKEFSIISAEAKPNGSISTAVCGELAGNQSALLLAIATKVNAKSQLSVEKAPVCP